MKIERSIPTTETWIEGLAERERERERILAPYMKIYVVLYRVF